MIFEKKSICVLRWSRFESLIKLKIAKHLSCKLLAFYTVRINYYAVLIRCKNVLLSLVK